MYVFSFVDNPCCVTLTGDKIRSILFQEKVCNYVTMPLFFCIDINVNIVISDNGNHSIKVFTAEGEFLHQMGRKGHEKEMFFTLRNNFN